jgi:hypothetical protein
MKGTTTTTTTTTRSSKLGFLASSSVQPGYSNFERFSPPGHNIQVLDKVCWPLYIGDKIEFLVIYITRPMGKVV